MRTNRFACVVAASLAAAVASAAPIVYTFQATGSGTLNGVPFTSASFTITVQGDTANITNDGLGTYWNPSLSSTIDISGPGVATFTDVTQVFCNQVTTAAGFADADLHTDLLNLRHASFATYALATAFGPVFDAAPWPVGPFHDIATNRGPLTFTSYQDATFTAILVGAVPTAQPLGLALMALLVVASGVFLLRRLL